MNNVYMTGYGYYLSYEAAPMNGFFVTDKVCGWTFPSPNNQKGCLRSGNKAIGDHGQTSSNNPQTSHTKKSHPKWDGF